MKTSWKPLDGTSHSYSTVNKRAVEFKRGRDIVETYGRPKDATADVNVKVVHILVVGDRRRDLRSRASELGISFGAVQLILSDILGMSKVSARWVPRMLTDNQKMTLLNISRYFLSRYEDNSSDFIKRVVTQDDIWAHLFDLESKCTAKQ